MKKILFLICINYPSCSGSSEPSDTESNSQSLSSLSATTSVQAIDSSALKIAQEYTQKYAQAAYGFHISPQDICKATIAAAHIAQANRTWEYAPSDQQSSSQHEPTISRKKRGAKKVPCTWPGCNKQLTNITRHLMTHTKSKPFQCPSCDKKSNLKTNLVRHFGIHIIAGEINCQTCKKYQFNTAKQMPKELFAHITKDHPVIQKKD